MDSAQEASVPEDGFYVEGGDQTKSLSPAPGPDESSDGEGSLLAPNAGDFPLVSQLEASESTSVVLWAGGCWPESPVPGEDENPDSPVEDKVVGLDFLSPTSVDTVAIGQPVSTLESPQVGEQASPEGICVEPEPEMDRRGLQEAKSASATSLFPKGLEHSRAWVTPRKNPAGRGVMGEDPHLSIPEPELPEELNEMQMMRVTICLKDGVQSKTCGPAETPEVARPTNVQNRDSLIRMSSSLLTSTTRGLAPSLERQASKELEGFSSKKKAGGALWGKGAAKPSYPDAPVASVLPKASPRKKMTPKKKPLWDASTVTLGRAFHQWGQRLKSAPAEPATFPPISGVGLPGRSNKCSLLPLRPKQCKNFYTGKRSGAKRTRDLQVAAKEDTELARDPCSQGAFSTHRAEAPSQSGHQEFSSGDISSRSLQDPANSPSSTLSQKGAPRRPAPSGDQELPLGSSPPDPEVQHGIPCCPRCPELQKEIENLKKQLWALQAVNEKFQALSS
uniref:RIKEN cDNA 4933412E24 gene n=1 Tax=Cricetulus griseus TaxID=10029 RepID=A0A8C2LG06_CRIGR